MVHTYTRTTLKEPEAKDNSFVSLEPPTQDEIVKQLIEHFAKHPKDVVTQEDIYRIADKVTKEFESLKNKPYGAFAKYNPEKPALHIFIYSNEYMLTDFEKEYSKYSPVVNLFVKCTTIDFHITVIEYLKQIHLSYVSRKKHGV